GLTVAIVVMVASAGCDKPKQTNTAEPTAPAAPAAAPAAQAPAARSATAPAMRDASLTLAEYIDAGVPAPDRVWTSADYQAASAALERIGKDRDVLPRWRSDKSGALFERLVDARNLDLLRDHKTPPDMRLAMGADYMKYSNELLRAYVARNRSG